MAQGIIRKVLNEQEKERERRQIEQGERPIDKLKKILNSETIQEHLQNVLRENANIFIASLIDLYQTEKTLQLCDPKAVVLEALKAASLKLPINRQLGFVYIVPFKDTKTNTYVPVFMLGYKGYIQLAMRTGAYKYINADVVYEGELEGYDKLTGEIKLNPSSRKSNRKIGYFAYIETLNGFRKTLYMTTEEIIEHAKRFSKSYGKESSIWATDFDSMAIKTVLKTLLSKYGIMSIEMQTAFTLEAPQEFLTEQEELESKIEPELEPATASQEKNQPAQPEHQSTNFLPIDTTNKPD